MADNDQSIYNLRYNQVLSTLEGFGGGSPAWTQVTITNTDPTQVPATRLINTTAPLMGGGNLSADRTLSMPAATSLVDGYLLHADWAAFNGKQAALGYTPVNKAGDTMTGILHINEIDGTTGGVGINGPAQPGQALYVAGQLQIAGSKIIGVSDPTNPQDAATKNYVDTHSGTPNIVQATFVGPFSTTNATYQNSGASVTITPSSLSAKIKITFTGIVDVQEALSGNTIQATIKRGATDLDPFGGAGLLQFGGAGGSAGINLGVTETIQILDMPSSTSPVTYTFFLQSGDGTNPVSVQNAVFIAEEIH